MRIGAVEAGGTKFVCGIGTEDGIIEEKISFPTEDPAKTLDRLSIFSMAKAWRRSVWDLRAH